MEVFSLYFRKVFQEDSRASSGVRNSGGADDAPAANELGGAALSRDRTPLPRTDPPTSHVRPASSPS